LSSLTFHHFEDDLAVRALREVAGALSLHGVQQPIKAAVFREGDAYVGSSRIRQTSFGMAPQTVAGGLVKVEDELEIRFSIRASAEQATES
jgi:hypothetical protein